ncbi:MAG: hypothetical protein WDN01_05655 [Rhizomicrobium sp.]
MGGTEMIDIILPALLLNFAAVTGTMVRRAGYENISQVSQILSVPLILGGILAGFAAIYASVAAEGWLTGLAIWFVSGLILAAVASAIRTRWDGILSILASVSLLAGAYLFFIRFV